MQKTCDKNHVVLEHLIQYETTSVRNSDFLFGRKRTMTQRFYEQRYLLFLVEMKYDNPTEQALTTIAKPVKMIIALYLANP